MPSRCALPSCSPQSVAVTFILLRAPDVFACAASARGTLDLAMPRSPVARRGSLVFAAALALLLGGCANLSYYMQSVSGQLDIWRRQQPIQEVVGDPATSEPLKRKLSAVLDIRAFASRELLLPDNRSYRLYADLGRPYVVWNVFATHEFSVQPVQWSFFMVGCVSYRG